MTHDELLNEIENAIPDIDCNVIDHYPMLKALRAVVELHKPATENSFTNNDCVCMLPGRKCATIQAIEKELE